VFIAPDERGRTTVITPCWCRLIAQPGFKLSPERFFGIVIKKIQCSARTDRLNDRVLIALSSSLNGTPVALTALYPAVRCRIENPGATD
jgi:hypothetical protein